MSPQRNNLPILAGAAELPVPAAPPLEEPQESPGMSMAQVVVIVRSHLKRSLISVAVLLCISVVLIKIMPHSYVATATLIVNQGNRNPLVDPAGTGWNDTFIPTQIELIQGPEVLQPVIDQLHLMGNPEWAGGFKGPPAALREAIYNELLKSLNIYQGSGSALLYIAASAKHPDEAAAIANAIVDQYLQLNRQRIDQPAAQNADIYAKELEQLRQKTIEAQQQVTTFRQQHGMIDIAPGNGGDDAETALRVLEQRLLAAQNQERNVEAQLQARAWGTGSAAPAAGAAAGAGAGGNSLAGTLAIEETDLARLRQTLGPRHPQVLALESQIAATKRALASGLTAQLADARSLVDRYSSAVQTQREVVLAHRREQDQGAKLLLELDSAQATYKKALDTYPQIQFASKGASNDVSLVSSAVPPVKAVKPNKTKYLLVAFVFSLGVSFGIPFAWELFLNRRLRCRDDLERNFGIPVLAQFGPIDRA